MIVLDTTVLVYAVGAQHPLREPSRQVIGAVRAGGAEASTTVEAIQELVHVRSRRRPRSDAAHIGRAYAVLLGPLLRPTEADLQDGLTLFEAHPQLGAFDAVLAATAIRRGAEALVSADSGFEAVPGLVHLQPGSPELVSLLGL